MVRCLEHTVVEKSESWLWLLALPPTPCLFVVLSLSQTLKLR